MNTPSTPISRLPRFFASNVSRLFAMIFVVATATIAEAQVVQQPATAATAVRPNVLFIMADDLRAELGTAEVPAKTPNLDRLASRGVVFQRAYCQQALCNPSRSSLLTGLRPDTLGLWNNKTHFRELKPEVVTLPEAFKNAGYATRNVGKIFHNAHTAVHGDRQSWSSPEFLYYAKHGDDKPKVDGEPPLDVAKAPNCERRDAPDNAYYDGQVADEAIRVLGEIQNGPFFLAVGFWKPHAPFNAPTKYWGMYDRDLLLKVDPTWPTKSPGIASHDSRELLGIPPKQLTLTPEQIAEMRHGYFANTSYMDAQVGKVLAALDASPAARSTIVVFCADHGYHIGEHGLWGKTSCFELDARVPLIISVPGSARAGARTTSLVELVDLYPTLAALCGVTAPAALEGTNLGPLLSADPAGALKSAAFTQHPRPAYYDRTEKGTPDAMGYSVRTERVRYTEWREWPSGKVIARELYDHERDVKELHNVIDNVELQATADEAAKLVRKQFPVQP
ncbi:MAG: sulfatase [Planctomycetia bacterium]|nr:sulfatase [Planctomycetia bacterium]